MYKHEILHQSVKSFKTKSQKVLEANFYVCRSYSGKTDRGRGVNRVVTLIQLTRNFPIYIGHMLKINLGYSCFR